MEKQPARNFTRLAVAIVVAAVVLSAAALSYQSFRATVTRTSISVSLVTSITTSTMTVTDTASVVTETTTTSPAASTCIQLESSPMYLTVKNSSTGDPVSSLPIQVEELPEATDPCSTTASTTLNLGTMETDANGSISVCCTGSIFFFRFTYDGVIYHVSELANGAEAAECVTFYVPSNVTAITYPGDFVYPC